jgi:hypothetical protein
MPVGLRDRRRISQKLPSLQRRPKRLKQLSNRLFENRIVINTLPESSGVATTATTRGTLYGSEQNQGQQRAAITFEAWLRLVIERHDDLLGGSGWQHQVEGPFGFGEEDAVADQLGEAFPVLGRCPRDLPWARGRRCP